MNVLDCIPEFIPNQITYRRLEPNGFEVFRTKKHPELNEMLFNPSSQEMLKLCDGEKTFKIIMSELMEKYEVEESLLFKDLYELYFNCWRMGLIAWVNGNPYKGVYMEEKSGFAYRMLTEEDAVQRVVGKEFEYVNPYAKKEWDYSEAFVRQYSFRYQETYFVLEKGNKDILLMSLICNFNNANFLTIGLLQIYEENQVSEDLIKSFFRWCSEMISKHIARQKKFTSVVMYTVKKKGITASDRVLTEVFDKQGMCRAEFSGEHPDLYVYQLLL